MVILWQDHSVRSLTNGLITTRQTARLTHKLDAKGAGRKIEENPQSKGPLLKLRDGLASSGSHTPCETVCLLSTEVLEARRARPPRAAREQCSRAERTEIAV
jgi:hypothetical protein